MKPKLMSLSLFAVIVLTANATPLLRAQDAPRTIEVTAKRFAFDPGVITLKKGQPVMLILKSVDATHGLRFHDLKVDVKVTKGGTVHVSFTPDKAGDYVGHCSVFCGSGHGSMMLTLHVVD